MDGVSCDFRSVTSVKFQQHLRERLTVDNDDFINVATLILGDAEWQTFLKHQESVLDRNSLLRVVTLVFLTFVMVGAKVHFYFPLRNLPTATELDELEQFVPVWPAYNTEMRMTKFMEDALFVFLCVLMSKFLPLVRACGCIGDRKREFVQDWEWTITQRQKWTHSCTVCGRSMEEARRELNWSVAHGTEERAEVCFVSCVDGK